MCHWGTKCRFITGRCRIYDGFKTWFGLNLWNLSKQRPSFGIEDYRSDLHVGIPSFQLLLSALLKSNRGSRAGHCSGYHLQNCTMSSGFVFASSDIWSGCYIPLTYSKIDLHGLSVLPFNTTKYFLPIFSWFSHISQTVLFLWYLVDLSILPVMGPNSGPVFPYFVYVLCIYISVYYP